jgi:hypothetical protein
MKTIIAPLNKHQFLSNNQGQPANKINEMLKISLNILIKQTIENITKIYFKCLKRMRSNRKKEENSKD